MKSASTLVHPFDDSGSRKLLDGVAANAAAASRTKTLSLKKNWSLLRVTVDYTYSAGTAVTMTPTVDDGSGVYGAPQSISWSSGTGTSSSIVYSHDPSAADATITWDIDVRGLENIKLVFAVTSGGASDLLDVYATGITGY